MLAGGVLKPPDDVVRVIDAECLGGAGNGQGIVKHVENMNWHDTGSALFIPLVEGNLSLGRSSAMERDISRDPRGDRSR